MPKLSMNRSTAIWLGVILLSSVLMVTAVLYFRVQKIPVLTQDVVAGTQLTKSMYRLVDVNPQDQLLGDMVTNPSELFKDGNAAGSNGKYVLATMVKGQPVPKRLITANPLDPKFGVGSEVKQGEVAISVAVGIADAVGGAVDKGNVVDLTYVPLTALAAATGTTGTSTTGDFSTSGTTPGLDLAGATTIHSVRILEVRTENGMPRYSSSGTLNSSGSNQTKTLIITFAIPTAQMERFSVAAASGGRITLALPSRLDAGSAAGQTTVPATGTTTTTTP